MPEPARACRRRRSTPPGMSAWSRPGSRAPHLLLPRTCHRGSPGGREHRRDEPCTLPDQLLLTEGELGVVLPDEGLGCAAAHSTDRCKRRLVVDDDDLKVLHVVCRGRPTSRLEDRLKFAFGRVVLRIERDALRVAPADHVADLCELIDFAEASHVFPPLACDHGWRGRAQDGAGADRPAVPRRSPPCPDTCTAFMSP